MAGTTVTDRGAVESSFVVAMVESGVSEDSARMKAALDHVRLSMGQSKITVFRHLFDGDEATAQRANDRFEAAYSRAVDAGDVGPMPGAAPALAEMREIGMHICLTTGFAPATRDRILAVLGWDDLIDLALSPADAGRGRPFPGLLPVSGVQLS